MKIVLLDGYALSLDDLSWQPLERLSAANLADSLRGNVQNCVY